LHKYSIIIKKVETCIIELALTKKGSMKQLYITLSLLVVFLFSFSQKGNAQYVTIPDQGFSDFLYFNVVYDIGCWDITGTAIDTTCPDVVNCTQIICESEGLTDITGIEIFKNLEWLWANYNGITSLPTLPPKLKILWADNNLLSSITNLPDSLVEIDLRNNNLVSMPPIPNKVEKLDLNNNNFTAFPIFPSCLRELDISNNQINVIPSLPDSLRRFGCQNLNLGTLPILPPDLEGLACDSANLTSLPALPNNLKALTCSNNHINNIPVFPNTLQIIDCSKNTLTSLPNMDNNVFYFNCSYNQLTSLPQLSDSLNSYICSHNALTSLPPFPTAFLNMVDVSFNLLTTIPPLTTNYVNYFLQNNQLTSLPELPSFVGSLNISNNPTLMCLPALKKINDFKFTNTGISCLPNYGTVTLSTPALNTIPLCGTFNNSGCNTYWNISGKDFLDANANCNYETTDRNLSNLKMQLYSGGNLHQQVYTGGEGLYSFDTDTFGTYITKVDTSNIPFTVLCPASKIYQDNVSVSDSMKYDRNFSMKCKEGNDAVVWSINGGTFKPGNIVSINIQAGDFASFFSGDCGTSFGGELQVILSGPITYVSPSLGALTPSYQNGDTIRYSVSDFKSIDHATAFRFIARTDTSALLGSIVNVQASISSDSIEYNYNNNFKSQNFVVVSSFDPNDKAVSPTTTLDVNGDKWLTYKIRFQNTGTASADNIYVLDTISTQLDISTFSLLSYSHPILVQLFNNRVAKFSFPNINLPDSTSNEPQSHGYIEYKIKANDTISVNNTISNTAYIYFDFNAPIITNTTLNTAINCQIPPTVLFDTVCLGEGYSLNGIRYLTDGIFQQHYLTKFGCDSIVELHLTTNKATIARNLSSLVADQNNGQYQWISCSTGAIIPGATAQSYQPQQSGNYAVIVNFAGCSDTSDCYYYSPLSLNEILSSQIKVAPNPFKNELKINLGNVHTDYLEVYSLIGELIDTQKIQSEEIVLNTKEWPQGMYLLRMISSSGIVIKRVVKQ